MGVKFDDDKVRLDLLPYDALIGIAHVLTAGVQKYPDRGWEVGVPWSKYFSAMMRHTWAWYQGKTPTKVNFLFGDLDVDDGLPHLWHAGCCLLFLISYEARGMTAFDDRPAIDPRTKK